MLRLALLALLVCGSYANGRVGPLEIIQPRAGLNTSNRFYKAFPGLPYNVQIAVIGGKFPNTYRLNSGPSGMTVNVATGELNWPAPTESATPYNVSVSVTDAEGTMASVSWTVLVTQIGFRFVDAVNGRRVADGGTGTRANPWRSIADFYISKYDSTYSGNFVYFRAGTYRTNEAPVEDSYRLALSGVKPLVWLAYPGERPVIDVTGSHLAIYGGGCSNTYFEGFEISHFTTNFGVRMDSNATDVTFRKNTFRDLPVGAGGSGTNASGLMISNAGSVGSHWAIVENTFADMYGQGYGVLGYYTTKVLVERNRVQNFNAADSKGIGPKMNNSFWYIRDNRISMNQGQGIWVDTYATTGSMEIAYNLVTAQNDSSVWVGQENTSYGPFEFYRNTLIGRSVLVWNLLADRGPFSFLDDVIVSSNAGANGLQLENNSLQSRITLTGVLSGLPSAGIVDGSGNLAGTYTQYVGQKGYQRNGSAPRLASPGRLRVL